MNSYYNIPDIRIRQLWSITYLKTYRNMQNSNSWVWGILDMNNHCAKKASNHHANLPLEMYSFTL